MIDELEYLRKQNAMLQDEVKTLKKQLEQATSKDCNSVPSKKPEASQKSSDTNSTHNDMSDCENQVP